jgi:hypothetical protein
MTQKGNLLRQVKGVARIGRSGIKIHPVLQYLRQIGDKVGP